MSDKYNGLLKVVREISKRYEVDGIIAKRDAELMGKLKEILNDNTIKLLCKKDCEINGNIEFKKGKYYNGKLINEFISIEGINTFTTKGENGFEANFHTGSDYFEIK